MYDGNSDAVGTEVLREAARRHVRRTLAHAVAKLHATYGAYGVFGLRTYGSCICDSIIMWVRGRRHHVQLDMLWHSLVLIKQYESVIITK